MTQTPRVGSESKNAQVVFGNSTAPKAVKSKIGHCTKRNAWNYNSYVKVSVSFPFLLIISLSIILLDGHFSSLPIPNRDVVFLAGYCVAYADKYLAEEIAHAHLNSKANSADGEPEIVVINLRHFPETISTVNGSGALSEEDEQVGKGKGAWMTSVIFIFPSNKDADSKVHVGWMDLTRFGIGRK